jgi:hypothetical protein
MRDAPKRQGKSETLTIRLDPKMRFALEFVARLRGQSITTVVERAIKREADQATLSEGQDDDPATWINYWNIIEGIRALNLAGDQRTFPSFDEEEKLAFVKYHWPFFYTNKLLKDFNLETIDILWPRIDEFLVHWRQHKAQDRLATGKLMQTVLRDAKGQFIPKWPQDSAPAVKTPSWEAPKGGDLDNEIPF